jgi:aromatic ring-cleaving dioxygenase
MEKDTFVEEAAMHAEKMIGELHKIEYLQILEIREGDHEKAMLQLRLAQQELNEFISFLEKRTAK